MSIDSEIEKDVHDCLETDNEIKIQLCKLTHVYDDDILLKMIKAYKIGYNQKAKDVEKY